MTKGLDVLQLIQDVDWVVGSFIADPDGELLVYLMPPEFGEEGLRRTATRLASIVRSAELCGVDVEQCDFSFSRYQLVVYRSEAGIVGVLVEAPVSRRALSMAARIALAELPKLVASLEASVRQTTPREMTPRAKATSQSPSREASRNGDAPRAGLPLDRFGPIASITPPE
jgi:hypothetical protein